MAALLFDLDGTLLDTVPLITTCFQKMFQKYGNTEISTEAVHALFGPGESIIFRQKFGNQWEKVLQDYLECYVQGHNQLQIESWVLDLLKELHAQHIPLAIVTNKERDTTSLTLDYFQLSHYFSMIITAQDVERPKPHPDGIVKILQALDVPAQDAILIGDTMNDKEAARQSGIQFIQALWYVPKPLWPKDPQWQVAHSEKDLRDTLQSFLL